ncbi:O-succinylbenzoic acid--CoA ligase [Mesoflavibacter sp. HG96]|uniref:AMP-binding protein n=1 Tax=unclassified Mesoflavibacter TaxID=2630131 RepID=UPI000D0F23A4|nr:MULTISPECIES: AMP-binding protein [unclassified Mesoflavibacter]QIJ90404.1 O-succinylbenzoic acid--CoA ligase [Mesoflavibacter sp. HG96]QIJ93132.1 O-succinylbenzoic acid--CoA ligase [Mesoflavibacter sp. HG37]
MIPTFNNIHNRFKLNGTHYNFEDLKEVAYSLVKEGQPFEKEIGQFLLDWQDQNDFIIVKTSGSTGQPKAIKINKQAMVHSAIATGDFFSLEPGNTALMCLPANYIAGKMMLVRALILGLEIEVIEPKTNPIFDNEVHYDFCAMIPIQVQKAIQRLDHINTLIIGGASVNYQLKEKLQNLKVNAYETYGMTETITHIAVKKLNNFNADKDCSTVETSYFETLPNIKISQNKSQCLVIDAPKMLEETIETNDVVKLHSATTFEWLGRKDNVINSGGVKLFPEQIETKLQPQIASRFFISKENNDKFGEQVILVVEDKDFNLKPSDLKDLSKLEMPKNIYTVDKFIETSSGKINRGKTLQLLQK